MRTKKYLLSILLGAFVALSSLFAMSPESLPQDNDAEKDMVVFLHGLGRGNSAMWLLAARLEDAGFLVERVGYSSLAQSPDEIVAEVSRKIDASSG